VNYQQNMFIKTGSSGDELTTVIMKSLGKPIEPEGLSVIDQVIATAI
jgi:hypothetical protein